MQTMESRVFYTPRDGTGRKMGKAESSYCSNRILPRLRVYFFWRLKPTIESFDSDVPFMMHIFKSITRSPPSHATREIFTASTFTFTTSTHCNTAAQVNERASASLYSSCTRCQNAHMNRHFTILGRTEFAIETSCY